MSNSSLATIKVPAYTGNYTEGREGKQIKKITIHHMAGKLTARRCGELFQAVGRNGSSHYGVGYDGDIAQYVDEADTAWTDSNWESNTTSVTIETANSDNGGNWPVNDTTLASLIKLVADIAIRNNLGFLIKGKNLTWHQMYAATTCPGPYLLSKMEYICEEANKIISGDKETIITRTPVTITYQVYDGAWLGNISGYDIDDSKYGYAGGTSKPVSGVYANASVGNVFYRVHQKGGQWLPEVKNREDYAGNLSQPIDGFMIKSDSTTLRYRAHDKTHGWLDEISGYDINDPNTGYAGWTGYEIDAIMIRADDIVTVTQIEKPKEEPAPVVEEIYRIRISWEDAKSQAGAYKNLDSAIRICQEKSDATGVIYSVYDSVGTVKYTATARQPEVVQPETTEPEVSEPEVVVPVYNLDYPNKVLIIDRTIERTNKDCVKAIKKILSNNQDFDVEIAKAFFKLAPIYGIDPMMAISQSILETGWFKYNGSAVKPEHHNYCGLGVTRNGITGGIFDTIEDGVTAQYQHLFAYGCKDNLDEEILDPRFSLVTRGIAPYWQNLAGRWAVPGYDKNTYSTPKEAMEAENTYGQKIINICKQINEIEVKEEEIGQYFVQDKPVDSVPPVAVEPEVTTQKETTTEPTLAELLVQLVSKLLAVAREWLARWFSK